MSERAFTTGQIARAANISRQAVAAGLATAAPAGQVAVDGKPTDAWLFEALPLEWKLEITRRGVKRGFENGEGFLQSLPLSPWKAPLPWERVSKREQDKAAKLQKALARALKMRGKPPGSSRVDHGVEDFKAEFGYTVSARHWRRLFDRTIERDGGEEDWQRIELYIDDRAFAVRHSPAAAVQFDHRELDGVIEALENRVEPTAEDRLFIWREVLAHYNQHTDTLADSPEGNRERRAFKLSLVSYLFAAFPGGTLCANESALCRLFELKLSAYKADGESALRDGRRNSGRQGEKLCPECRKLLIGATVDFDGNYAQAWRRLQLSKKLCAECLPKWHFDVRANKSYVPRTVVRDVRSDVESALPWRRGPHFVKLSSPPVRRDWSDTAPGDSTVCDDATPDHAICGHVQLPLAFNDDPRFGLFIGRLEVLFAVDERTDYPKAFVAILGEPGTLELCQQKAHYNQVHERLLFLREHDQVGLPWVQWKLENGPWLNRLNDGERLGDWKTIGFAKFANGLAESTGRRVRHTEPGNPRSKIIERVFGACWSRMKCHPGYLGNNERLDGREALKDFIARAKARKEDPRNELLSISDYVKVLSEELMAFAQEPQNGHRLPGVSPFEAWLNGIDGHPGYKARGCEQLSAKVRFLLATHERIINVGANGVITFTIGTTPYYFWGEELDNHRKQPLLCRFNFEEPDILSCSPKDSQPFTVKARVMKSNTATKEELAETARARASWTRHGKIIYDRLPHPFQITISRDSKTSEEVRFFGEQYGKELEQHKAEQTKAQRQARRAREKISATGFDTSRLRLKNPEQVAAAVERLSDRIAALRQKEAQEKPNE